MGDYSLCSSVHINILPAVFLLCNVQYLLMPFYLFNVYFCCCENQGIALELDEEWATDEEEREVLQDIANNAKLSEGYLTLARDIEVMEPKSPEDIYKV